MVCQWNDWNREHIAKHGVSPAEAQYVAEHASPPFPRTIEDEKHLVWGKTKAGRLMQVIFVYLSDGEVDFQSLTAHDRLRFEDGEDVCFVIHAMELTEDQKRQYRRKKRR